MTLEVPVPSRLMIRAPNWLGDAVMALPAIGAVRRAFPRATLAIAAPASVAPLFREDIPAAPDEVVTIRDGKTEAETLAAGRYDTALLLPNSFGSAWKVRQAGIPHRWGYSGSLRSPLLTSAVKKPRGTVHQSSYYLHLARGLGFDAPDALPALEVRPETRARAAELLEGNAIAPDALVIGFAPGAAYGHAKRWPPSRVTDVIARLSREHGAACVLVGAAGDRDAAREIESSLPAGVRALNLAGKTDLRMLAGVIARCRAFVSNDSGAMHLAAAIGVRVVAIFGPTDDRVTAPLGDHDVLIHQVFCRPCMLRDCPIDHRCMKGITVDAVCAAIANRL